MKLNVIAAALLAAFLGSELASASVTVNFDDGTYTDGALNTQNGFIAATGGNGFVVTSGEVTTGGFGFAINSAASAIVQNGASYTASADFVLTYADDTPAGSPAINVQFFNAFDIGAPAIGVNLTANGRFRHTTNWGNTYPPAPVGFNQSGVVSDIGSYGLDLANGDMVTDTLRITSVLTAGPDTSSWSITSTLENTLSNTILLTYTTNDIEFAAPAGSQVFGGFGGGQSVSNSQLSSRAYSSFSFSSTATAIPEPSGFAALCLGVGAVLQRRRRQKS